MVKADKPKKGVPTSQSKQVSKTGSDSGGSSSSAASKTGSKTAPVKAESKRGSRKSKRGVLRKIFRRSPRKARSRPRFAPARSSKQSSDSASVKAMKAKQISITALEESDSREAPDFGDIEDDTSFYKPAVPLENIRTSILDAIAISSLLFSTNTMFTLPMEVLRNGGCFFLVIYFLFAFLISFPILHLELFVSQYLQSGILKAIQLHGIGFTGIGLSVLVLIMANQNLAIHNGYYLLSHVLMLTDSIEQIVDCNANIYGPRSQCESLFNNRKCVEDNEGNVYVYGRCTNFTKERRHFERNYVAHAPTDAYVMKFMETSQENINSAVIGFEYAFLFFCACTGMKGLRYLLILTFAFVALYFTIVVMDMPHINRVLSILWMYSNPVALFRMTTYLTAFRMSVQTYGHCVFGLFCLSSFRNKNGRSYLTATMIFWIMMVAALFALLNMMILLLKANELDIDYIYTTTSISTRSEGVRFAVAAMTEYASLIGTQSNLLISSYLLFLVMDLTSVFGVIFVVFAFIRDFYPRHGGVDQRLVVFLYLCCSCTYYFLFTISLADSEHTVEESFVTFSKYIFICAEIIVFVHSYGIHEFEIDIVDTLGERAGLFSFANPTSILSAYNYSIVALVAMQAIECNRLSGWLQFRNLYDRAPDEVDTRTVLNSAVFLIPWIIPLVTCYLKLSRAPRGKDLTEMISVTELHPSFKRVKGAFMAQEMAGDNLLDRTPPSEPSDSSPGSGDDKKLDSEERTAPARTVTARSVATSKEIEEKTAPTPLSVTRRGGTSMSSALKSAGSDTRKDDYASRTQSESEQTYIL